MSRAPVHGRVLGRIGEPARVVGQEQTVDPCPSLADFRDQDLRDTAVTLLAQAGCTLPEIRSFTGHSLESIHKILKHYLAIDREQASAALTKLVAYLDDKGAVP